MPDSIPLNAKRNQDRDYPDFDIYAGEQLVGRIYLYHAVVGSESWWWGLNTICIDGTFDPPMKGYERTFEAARDKFRAAFDRWIVWAEAIPRWNLKRAEIDKNFRKIGILS